MDLQYTSFEDSEQFEEDSSWISESEQEIKWSGWKRTSPVLLSEEKKVLSLIEICSKCIAKNYPFETVETYHPPIPDALQLRIAYYAFPENEEDIRLYSCLASGSNDKYKQGELLVKSGNVTNVLQIGFHLSGVVTQPVSYTPAKQKYNVAITFDRGLITSCHCSCGSSSRWCEHANALCIFRINHKDEVSLRAPVSESLGRLERDQLQKFAQYLISELPQQILPTAQRLLDELLSSKTSKINLIDGAPDPTGGASQLEEAKWVFDEASLQDNIKKILARFCGTQHYVIDSNPSFLTSVPPLSSEWSNLLRSFQGRSPEALWNLLSITRHLYSKGDCNSAHLLHLITGECLISYQMMFYWILSYNTSPVKSGGPRGRQDASHYSLPSTHESSRHASAHLMEEIVHLWELTIMTPFLNGDTKLQMKLKFEFWNQQVIEAARKGQGQGIAFNSRMLRDFPGFKAPLDAAEIDWDQYYQVLGIEPINQKNSLQERSSKQVSIIPPYDVIYHQLVSLKPESMDEFTLINKLTQSLYCHGYVEEASKLACVVGQKIITTYPERVSSGELNFTEITEKAKALCEIFVTCPENERITFELAILGLTVPRLPATKNLEEMKLTYLETELYKRLKGMLITEERLSFIRYQARKLLVKPMLRGDIVLPYIVAIFIFEVLCNENIISDVYSGPKVSFASKLHRTKEDELLGYQCALVTLGLLSNAVDHKHPMLCESIRQFRRDLALVLLLHCRASQEKIEEVLGVLLDKERYPFMVSSHLPKLPPTGVMGGGGFNGGGGGGGGSKKKKGCPSSPQRMNPKFGFTFADIDVSSGGKATSNIRVNPPLSDSDSGNGDAPDKRLTAPITVSKATVRKTQQQRRQTRQNTTKNRGSGSTNNCEKWNRKSNTRTKTRNSNSGTNNKPKRSTMTDSDSGQDVNSPDEGDFPWIDQTEDWGAEMEENEAASSAAGSFQRDPLPTSIPSARPSWADENRSDNRTSGEGSSLSSSDGAVEQFILPKKATEAMAKAGEISHTIEDISVVALIPGQSPAPVPMQDDEDDFNIAAEMFEDLVIRPEEPDECPSDPIASSSSGTGSNASLDRIDQTACLPDDENLILKEKISRMSSDDQLCPEEEVTEDVLTVAASQPEQVNLQEQDDETDMASVPAQPIVVSEYDQDNANFDVLEILESDVVAIGNEIKMEEVSNCIVSAMPESLSKQLEMDEKQFSEDTKSSELSGHHVHEVPPDSDEKPGELRPVSLSLDSGNDSGVGATANSVPDSSVRSKNKPKDVVEPQHCQKQTTQSNSNIQLRDLESALALVHKSSSASTNSSSGSPMEIRSKKTQQISSEFSDKKQKSNKNKKSKAKNKKNKHKNKVTMNMQSVEAEAFSLFELAKSLLHRSNGSGVFTVDVDEVSTSNNVNRRLQLAAFEIGIFSLSVHNYSSPNWFSRTYSSYVSWIENIAVQIGTSALRLLNDKWEGVLTPSESVQIAGRACRNADQVSRRTAAELSLSCLQYCQSLNLAEVMQTIDLCREEGPDLLERACAAVENASRRGGVQPELLFRIAREWHYLHEEKQKRDSVESSQSANPNSPDHAPRLPGRISRNTNRAPAQNSAFLQMYMTPEQFVQEKMHQQAQEMLGRQLPRNAPQEPMNWAYQAPYFNQLHHVPLPQQMMHSRRISNIDSYAMPISNFPDEMNFSEIPRHLQNAYRVGMLALEGLTERMPDERPETRFAAAPPCSEDIRWMCALSASLGPAYLKSFCKIVYNAVTSPFLLHDLALESARNFALFNPAHLTSHLRSPSVSPIVQKALAMFKDKVHYEMMVLQPNRYDEFVDLLKRTRSAFCMAPGGMARFNDILERVWRTYPKKCELRQKIMAGLSTA